MHKGIKALIGASLSSMVIMSRPIPAHAWGDEGHKVVALIAQSFLQPEAKKKVTALLAADTDNTTQHDIANAATWADKIKNQAEWRQISSDWHFVDIEMNAANDLDTPCFGHPKIPPGKVASAGPADDCIIDKIGEFTTELADPATDPEERVIALKFLLHFVGDLHQPLHAADDHDRGGNNKRVSAPGIKPGNLHHYWDTEFVLTLGSDPDRIAEDLLERISNEDVKEWQKGTVADWAKEGFVIARDKVYGQLPQPNARHSYRLTEDYVEMAAEVVPEQLSKAGVRLAFILNDALK